MYILQIIMVKNLFSVVIPFKSGLFFEYNEKTAFDNLKNLFVVIPFKSGLFFESSVKRSTLASKAAMS